MRIAPSSVLVVAVLAACGTAQVDAPPAEGGDAVDAVAVTGAGKADGGYSDCELVEVVAFANDPSTDVARLRALGLDRRVSGNIVARRDGPDGVPDTADDAPFVDAADLDAVPYVGPKTFAKLVAAVQEACAAPAHAPADAEAIFSPQAYRDSHLARVVQHLDGATRSVDIAMYSLRDAGVMDALRRATARGVSVRVLFDTASEDRKAPAGTTSAQLEDLGADVRWINKILHHKLAIVDGPRTSADEAATATVITGSGNWSSSAATKYDENTSFVQGHAELALRFQREFNHLWRHSRPLDWNPSLAFFESMEVTDGMIAAADDPALDVVFTSANFRTTQSTRYGPGFSVVPGESAVADRLVALIDGAERSIHVASGHLRSRPVAEAILRKRAARPDVDVRVYLDGQEYLSASTHRTQVAEQEACLVEAGDDARDRQACLDKAFLYSYALHDAGVPLRYKLYAYRWDVSYAAQMHHKYLLVDGRVLATGSYNLSDNAEHATMENLVIWDAAAYPGLVASFEANFERMWVTGEAEGRFASLLDDVQDGEGAVPLVFDPMALGWDEVTQLKRAIRVACPAADSAEYRQDAPAHRVCVP